MLSVAGDNATLDAVATEVNEKLKRVGFLDPRVRHRRPQSHRKQ
jgi:hypothetical protein